MRYLIAGLIAFLLAASVEARTTQGTALPVKTEPGQPIEATIVGGVVSATVIEGTVDATITHTVTVTGAVDGVHAVGVGMANSGLGTFGSQSHLAAGDVAMRPDVVPSSLLTDKGLLIHNAAGHGPWAVVGIPLLNVNGGIQAFTTYVRQSGTTFTIVGGESGYAAHTKDVNVVQENSIVGAGDALFPVGFEVDAAPVGGSLTNGDYARPKVNAEGVQYVVGRATLGLVPTNGQALQVSGSNRSSEAVTFAVVEASEFDAGITLTSQATSGAVLTGGLPLLNVTGDAPSGARFNFASGTTFTSDEESGIAAHVKQVNPPTDAAWTRDSNLADTLTSVVLAVTSATEALVVLPTGTNSFQVKFHGTVQSTNPSATDFITYGTVTGTRGGLVYFCEVGEHDGLDVGTTGATIFLQAGGGNLTGRMTYTVSQNPD